ncbi:MAG: hypothetical protein COX44_00885 [Candidatus Portnoybacteria bacterium CG23_combo_of_CG06-09_8_20_14_all_37_13]|uniref:RCC1-like domain-containing protein n=1 Tax=Candidatus Portnoybacteria bacterium CG23_combo_of_CG06-09_8_20_14_all_37_13 TaxID=1974819 RepID=A0A2G9YDD4_9BACT|nr:MAG: hypothetical protein COX44_00885 [Candidatus Portnoybacteria bacterium CG23_combo_of_CG06-09_8_20_14_all_37_13]
MQPKTILKTIPRVKTMIAFALAIIIIFSALAGGFVFIKGPKTPQIKSIEPSNAIYTGDKIALKGRNFYSVIYKITSAKLLFNNTSVNLDPKQIKRTKIQNVIVPNLDLKLGNKLDLVFKVEVEKRWSKNKKYSLQSNTFQAQWGSKEQTNNLGDLNQDGFFDEKDLAILVSILNQEKTATDLEKKLGDLNNNQQLDYSDYLILSALIDKEISLSHLPLLLGDVNKDKKIDKKDIDKLQDLIEHPDKLDPISFYQADLNFDEDLTEEDIDLLKQMIQTKEPADVTPDSTENHPPKANAGTDKTVQPNQTIILDGSGSYDPDNDQLTYKWEITSGGGSLTDADKAQAKYTAPTADGLAVIKLTVSDGKLDSSDEVGVGVKSPTIISIAGISTGDSHQCVLSTDKQVICEGDNTYGQLGIGTFEQPSPADIPTPVIFTGLTSSSVVKISAGAYHTCALLDNGRVACWGRDDNLQIGLRVSGCSQISGKNTNLPVEITRCVDSKTCVIDYVEQVIDISAGSEYTCLLFQDHHAECYLDESFGQLGGRPGDRSDDEWYNGCKPYLNDYGRFATGFYTNVTESEKILLTNIKEITAGQYHHTCALLEDGSIRCFGLNQYGQLGRGDSGDDTVRADLPVIGIDNAVTVKLGKEHTCAILDDDGDLVNGGPIKCWGNNLDGQLGTGEYSYPGEGVSTPVGVKNINNAVDIVLGDSYSCALLADKTVMCWGNREYWRPSVGSVLIPEVVRESWLVDDKDWFRVPPLQNVIHISGGYKQQLCVMYEEGKEQDHICLSQHSKNYPPVIDLSAYFGFQMNPGESITFDKISVLDADGDPLTYQWRIYSGDGVLKDADKLYATYTAPATDGESKLEIKVSDGVSDVFAYITIRYATEKCEVDRFATKPPKYPSAVIKVIPPIIGPEPTLQRNYFISTIRAGDTIQLDGSLSSDVCPLSYTWSVAPIGEIDNPNAVKTIFTAPSSIDGDTITVTIRLKVQAPDGAYDETSPDALYVTINDDDFNTPPTADVNSPLRTITGEEVLLGAVFSDLEWDDISSYKWSIIESEFSDPGQLIDLGSHSFYTDTGRYVTQMHAIYQTPVNPVEYNEAVNPNPFQNPMANKVTIKIDAKDEKGANGFAIIEIDVGNQYVSWELPSVNILGPSEVLAGESIDLDGISGSDADCIARWSWMVVDPYNFGSLTSKAITTYTAPSEVTKDTPVTIVMQVLSTGDCGSVSVMEEKTILVKPK